MYVLRKEEKDMVYTCRYESFIYSEERNRNVGSKNSRKEKDRKWNPNVKSTNVELISNVTGKPIELVKNEQSLPMSQKRKEKYD